jgi:DNA-binding NtrC family response regulator
MPMATILCVDDEPAVGVMLEHILTGLGHRPLLVSSVAEAMQTVARVPLDLIIADYGMPQHGGLELLSLLDTEGHRVPVIIMTGFASIEHAVTSIRSGAIDYLTKPVRAETLEIAVGQALEVVRLRRENETFRREIMRIRAGRALIGDSDSFRRVMDMIGTVALTRATVLLEGESGTGKELFARALHDQSPRAAGPFIAVNCAALPEGLIESALFGYERGAFTGATVRAAGAFERAHGGTLLLEEVSEMRLDLQSKLLRVIQEQEFERVGGLETIKVDVRLVATTNRDLRAQVEEGGFRSDLYYRLNVVPIRTPPLRERRDDIPRLVQHFLQRTAEQLGTGTSTVLPETIEMLRQHRWPGNVRELANAVERAVILARGGVLEPAAFEGHLGADSPASVTPPPPAPFNLRELERLAIERALEASGGSRVRAARLLGVSERTLRNKLNPPKTALPPEPLT